MPSQIVIEAKVLWGVVGFLAFAVVSMAVFEFVQLESSNTKQWQRMNGIETTCKDKTHKLELKVAGLESTIKFMQMGEYIGPPKEKSAWHRSF